MTAQAPSPRSAPQGDITQPRIGHAYAATKIDGGTESDCNVIYRGPSDGRHVLQADGGYFLGERTQVSEGGEPEFEFNTAHIFTGVC